MVKMVLERVVNVELECIVDEHVVLIFSWWSGQLWRTWGMNVHGRA